MCYFLNPCKLLWWLHTLYTPICGGFQPQMFACRVRKTVGMDSWKYNVYESTESQHFYYNGHSLFLTIKLWLWSSKLNQTFTTEVVEQETLMHNFWNSHLGHFGRCWQLVYTMTTLYILPLKFYRINFLPSFLLLKIKKVKESKLSM